MKFKKFIENKEETPTVPKKILKVFDFDGTVANVPERPKNWSGSDWWGSEDSLTPPDYNGEVNQEVINAFKQAKSDPNTKTILLTGRRGVVAPYVRNVLRQNNLYGKRIIGPNNTHSLEKNKENINNNIDLIHPKEHEPDAHEEHYSGDHQLEPDYPTRLNKKGKTIPDESTLAHKRYVVEKAIQENGGFEQIIFFDDRQDHIDAFKQLAKQWLKHGVGRVIIHQVYPPKFPGATATIVTYPVTADTTWNGNG